MRLAVSMWSVHPYFYQGQLDVLGFLDKAVEFRVQGVELLDAFWKDEAEELKRVQEKLAELDLVVASYSIGNDFVNADEDKRKKEVDKIVHAIHLAKALKTSVIRVFAGDKKEGIEYEQARQWILQGLSEGASYASSAGVTLALENHGLFAGKAQQVEDIITTINSEGLKSTFDTGNFLLVGDNPLQALKKLLPLVSHVHAKDFMRVDEGYPGFAYTGYNKERFLGAIAGEGMVELEEILALLRQARYEGFLSLEYEGPADSYLATKKSLEYLSGLMNKVLSK